MKYEAVIGLETHVELATKSKIFCSCGGHSEAKEPNDCVCPACSGMPGMLPVMNKKVVELAVTAGLLLNCDINKYTTFDKKNYYYPDLPCAYQITQLNHPICTNGKVLVKTSEGEREIRIKQIHMEEDAGKLVHIGNSSYVDFNRTSVPLIEIVTQPDFRSSEEVINYLTKLKTIFKSCGISECEEGAMRCDVNISIRPEGTEELGVRSEIKNMSSFEQIEKAIKYEIGRHTDALEYETEELVQETRRFDEASGKTFAMRNKETEADYRYFPDPNLMPIIIDDAWLDDIKSRKPEVDSKEEEYHDAGISDKEIKVIMTYPNVKKIIDDLASLGCDLKDASSWVVSDIAGLLSKEEKNLKDLSISAEKLSKVIKLTSDNTINRPNGKKVVQAILESDVDVDTFIKENGLDAKVDNSEIEKVIDEVLSSNSQIVSDFKGGKTKAFQALFGAAMKELKGIGDPMTIKSILEEKLK